MVIGFTEELAIYKELLFKLKLNDFLNLTFSKDSKKKKLSAFEHLTWMCKNIIIL